MISQDKGQRKVGFLSTILRKVWMRVYARAIALALPSDPCYLSWATAIVIGFGLIYT